MTQETTGTPVHVALDAALVIMQNGGSTVAAERSFSNLLKAYKIEGVSVLWRLDFIAAAIGGESPSSTMMRPVGPIGVNLGRVAEVDALAARAAAGQIATSSLRAEVERIRNLRSPYTRWVTVVAAACTAAAFSQLAGGEWGGLAVAFVAAGIGQFVRSLLQARKFPVAQVILVCGTISALLAGIGVRLGYSQVAPVTLYSSVVYMVPGLPLINGFIDVGSHDYLLIGMERMFNAVFLFLNLTIAIALAYALVLE